MENTTRPARQTIRAVIFDMDGVLIDSEPVYLEHQYQRMKKNYPWLTRASLYPQVGMSSQAFPGFIAGVCRRDVADPAFRQELKEIFTDCKVDYRAIMRPQVPAVLARLQAMGVKIALASSSGIENIRQVLAECDIAQYFCSVISGGQFKHSKPDPEIYRVTMQKLALPPEQCLVIEDSTYGVQAGVAAGATVAALRDERFPFDQSAAQLHMDSLAEIPALVGCGGLPIKAAFFDVDGTLVTMGAHKIPPKLPAALAKLRAAGVALLLCTGRHALEIAEEQMLPGLQFDGAVYLNGQLCELHGAPVLQNAFTPAQLQTVRQFLEQTGRCALFLEKDAMYCNRVDDRVVAGQAAVGTAVPPVGSLAQLPQRTVYQIIPYLDEAEEQALLARLPDCKVLRWDKMAVDLTPGNGGKEKGLRAICGALGIPPAQTIAFGDGENDIELLRAAGIGVAMGNADATVKRAADYVTETVEDDGIYKALRHFGLLG